MKGHKQNVNGTVGGPQKLLFKPFASWAVKNENFPIFNILAYEISVTTYLMELKFSGIREGVNKLAVLKFQSNPSSLRKNVKIWNSGKSAP